MQKKQIHTTITVTILSYDYSVHLWTKCAIYMWCTISEARRVVNMVITHHVFKTRVYIYIVVDNCLWHCDWMLVSVGGRWFLAPGTSLNADSKRDELGRVWFEVACDADEQQRMQFRWQQRCMAVLEMIPHENLPGYNRLNGLLFLGNSDWTTTWIFVLDGFNTLLTLLYFSSKYLVNLVHVFHVIPILRLLKV